MRHNGPLASIAILSSLALAGCETHYYHEDRVYQPAAVVVQEPVYVAPAPVVVTTFQADLNPYGQWVVIANYGQCWRPTQVVQTWRPYTVGRWVWTDYGWTWMSEEPWGDATCHYGRWFLDAQYGWVWMPGSTWAPAWVAWRSGGGYVGWAPLPPTVAIGVNVQITEYNTRDIPASHYSFVEERRVAEPRAHEHITSIQNNTTIINKTVNITNITNITTVNNTVVNKSLAVERVERASGRKIERVAVKETSSVAEARQVRGRGEVAAYRPRPVVEAERARVDDARRRESAPVKRPDADRPRDAKPEPVRPAPGRADADRAKAAELQREQAEKARAAAAEADRARAADLKRQETEKANAAAARRAEAEKARAAELKRLEAEKIKAAETEKARAAEARRREEADRIKRETPRPGETREQAIERARRETEREKEAAERGKKPKDDRGDNK